MSAAASNPSAPARVFYTTFGHRVDICWNPAMLQFLLDAIQLVRGDWMPPWPGEPPR